MRKFLTIAILTAMIASLGAALAQLSQSHPVEVRIPEVLMIRITSGDAITAVPGPTAVVFDLSSLTADNFEPAYIYAPTGPANWDNVRVFANRGGWRVTVAAVASNAAFDWTKVRVTPTGFPSIDPFSLAHPTAIAADPVRTNGWRSLGFGPTDFRLHLDGTEEAGTFTATVTYTITHY